LALNPSTNEEWETFIREASPENARKMRQFALDHIDVNPERWNWPLYIAAKVMREKDIQF
jgi:hypothetical protein